MLRKPTLRRLLPAGVVSAIVLFAALLPAAPLGALFASYSYGYIGRLGGILTTGPDAGSNSGRIDVFVRGTDKQAWEQSWNGTGWSGWVAAGGILTSAPGAVNPSSTETDLFVRGTDNQVWQRKSSVPQDWTAAWMPVGGVATTKPDAASWAPNRLDIIVGGTDSGLWHRASTDGGATWLPWDSAGGIVTSDPSIVATGANALTIFVRGTDNGLWYRQSAGAGVWGSWTPLGGILTSAPQAASCFAGHMDVVVRGTDNTFYRKGSTDNGVTWSNWQQLQAGGTAGSWQSDPGVGCDPANGNLFVFGKDGSNSLTYFTELAT